MRIGVWNSSTTPSAPQFRCPQKNDAFTVSDTSKGNGMLTFPVGLITADEVVAAGGKYEKANYQYYLNRSLSYWSFSPSNMNTSGTAYVFEVDYGFFRHVSVNSTYMAVVPVINLSAEYVSTMIGDGTMESPYRAENVNP